LPKTFDIDTFFRRHRWRCRTFHRRFYPIWGDYCVYEFMTCQN